MKKINIKILAFLIIILILLLTSCSFAGGQPPSSISQTIIIYGDSRTNHQIHQKIVNEIIKIKTALVFHTGDFVEDVLISAQWSIFNELVFDLMEIAEFYTALGNHENNSQLHFDNYDLPHNEQWYSVEKDTLHSIVRETNI